MYRNTRIYEIWYFKPAVGDGLRFPIKVKHHDISDVQAPVKENVVFADFAAKEFPRGTTCYHSVQSLNRPLLPLTDQVDQHVAIVLWNTILRFMGDLPEPRHTFLDTTTLEKVTKEDRTNVYSPKSWMSTSDKLRFIVGLGINRPHLRDEIYCQLCKQVTENPSSVSLIKGWVLLSLCLGCFIPSQKVEKVIVSAMRCGPDDYASYCDQKLRRIKKNGVRKQPPNSLELQAAQQMTFPSISIELTDGREVEFDVDSSTTAKELCDDAADEMGCEHISGYGIQISIFGKHINLGSGSEKLMDAIWVCEQTAREAGSYSASWKIFYCKDVFTPADEFLVDISWTDFAYQHVVNGIKNSVSRLTKRFQDPSKQSVVISTERSSTSEQSLSSNSSTGSFNDFGLPSFSDSGSDISSVEFGLGGKDFSQNETTTYLRVRETYTAHHSTIDVHTLKDYAEANFGSVNIDVENSKENVKTISITWSHQTEPIKQPLLLRLVDNHELAMLAVNMFSLILVYMQKCATPKSSKYYKMEITRKIFGPAIKQEDLQDELYCQIMKQITKNESKNSLTQGWELMFLCTGLFPCSEELLREVMLFLVTWSKYESMAMKSLILLRKTVQTGPRKYPPHFVEFAAATKRCDEILHKVSFPNLSAKTFDVNSRTRVKDMENQIKVKLGLSSLAGFSLFVQVFSKIVALNSDDFVFDAIQQWTEYTELKLPKPAVYNKAKGIPYKLLFLRRVWSSISPGHDTVADAIFLYPQEVSKFLRGYYKLTIEEVSYLAALILKQMFGDETGCPEITEIFEELLPHNMVEDLFPEVWRQYIVMNCQKITLDSSVEIRKEFLLRLQKHERFGSAYFKVGQKNFPNSPKIIIAGINCKAIHIIHPKTKDSIRTFPIETIVSHFRENNTYIFQVQRSIDKLETYTFYTTQDYEIENMVTSYIPQ